MLRAFGTPQAARAASLQMVEPLIGAGAAKRWCDAAQAPEPERVEQTLEWLAAADQHLVTLADADYPQKLLDLPDPPAVFYAKGRRDLLGAASLGIVGSRNATRQGIENAERFADVLSVGGIAVISGLAAGIDAAAHRGGLRGPGSTIAVVGTGLDRVYPASNRALAHEIASAGVIVSEFPLGSEPKAEHFPRRNRIIAALSLGTLVVEATLGSGSLITAKQAVDLGREVFAIPGSIHSPQSRGCHRLIKDGAKLVESADDILLELDWQVRLAPPTHLGSQPSVTQSSVMPLHDEKAAHVLDCLGFDPVDLDMLMARTSLTLDTLCAILLGFELSGEVAALPGGRYQRLGK
ncbi:DNA-processing protein DprA [Andreprevotia chitinilytica]|uniref:DNA-processing protein DprA n=1 Tax=Andreprevotia chitinilytica TaxID=396808 RepID=UPI000A620BFC|nr:DNA-processing protein DprA [Andreprevotia chitinilytica]